MDKLNLTISILAIIGLSGLITLIILDRDTTVLLPILTTLIGYLVGAKKEDIVSFFGK